MKRIRRLLIPTEGPGSALDALRFRWNFDDRGRRWADRVASEAPGTPEVPIQRYVAQVQAGQNAAPEAPKVSPYTKWLDEDVVYIIMPEERAAFLALQTDAEREDFIEQFWKRRDPTPGTKKTSSKMSITGASYLRTCIFQRRPARPAGRTDRGRIYIVYGPPDEIDDHSTGDAVRAVPVYRLDVPLYRRRRHQCQNGICGPGQDRTISR